MSSPRVYESVVTKSTATAVQFPIRDPLVAEKDHEEKIREIAKWLSNEGLDVTDMADDHITFITHRGERTAMAGTWIFKSLADEFFITSDEDFRFVFRVPKETDV